MQLSCNKQFQILKIKMIKVKEEKVLLNYYKIIDANIEKNFAMPFVKILGTVKRKILGEKVMKFFMGE